MSIEKPPPYVFKFECDQIWETLNETADEKVRHCQRCDMNVHFAQNDEEVIHNAQKGVCVYSFKLSTAGVIYPPKETVEKPPETKKWWQFWK